MRFFLAHSKRDGESQPVLDAYLSLARQIVGEDHEIVFARDDYLENAAAEGGWDGWCRSISSRTDVDTGARTYDGILVPSSRVGKATAAIVGHALEAGLDVYVIEGEKEVHGTVISADGWKVGLVETVDARDYLMGWALTPF